MNDRLVRFSRQTRQRALVYAVVASTRRHPTADWVYEQARRKMPSLSMGTVYRNLQVLEREGKIRAVDSWGRATRYDADLSSHDHFVCTLCGGIFDLRRAPASDSRIRSLIQERGYHVTGHRLEFYGACRECKKSKRDKREQD